MGADFYSMPNVATDSTLEMTGGVPVNLAKRNVK